MSYVVGMFGVVLGGRHGGNRLKGSQRGGELFEVRERMRRVTSYINARILASVIAASYCLGAILSLSGVFHNLQWRVYTGPLKDKYLMQDILTPILLRPVVVVIRVATLGNFDPVMSVPCHQNERPNALLPELQRFRW